MKTVRKHSNTQGQRDKQDHGQTELNNILVKKSSLTEINKEEKFTQGFKN